MMIANEMHRGSRLQDAASLRRCYERILRLTDLTAQAADRLPFRRELLRWRSQVALLYLDPGRKTKDHAPLLRCLLLMSPVCARQRPYLDP
jgi:hypothetical protein